MSSYKPKSDYEAFCKLKESYLTKLTLDDISDIWKAVHLDNQSSSVEEKYLIACSHINELFSTSKVERNISFQFDGDSYFESFVILCEDMFHISILEEIWSSIEPTITGENRFDIAVMFAIERLAETSSINETSNTAIIDVNSQFKSVQKENENRLPLFNGGQKAKKKLKKSKLMSSQQAVLDMLTDTFRGSDVPTHLIHEVAAKCKYDPEESINSIWVEYSRLHSNVRDGVSFAEVATSSRTSESNYLVLDSFQSSDLTEKRYPISTVENDSPSQLSIAAFDSRNQPESYHRFAEHFLAVSQRKNPHLHIQLDRKRFLTFEGPVKNYSTSEFDQDLRIDLHGLTVTRALELVESTINYFYSLSPISRSGKTITNKRYRLQFVVGRGLHSSGGIAKLKPAVEQYLRRSGESDVVAIDGEVHVHLNRSKR